MSQSLNMMADYGPLRAPTLLSGSEAVFPLRGTFQLHAADTGTLNPRPARQEVGSWIASATVNINSLSARACVSVCGSDVNLEAAHSQQGHHFYTSVPISPPLTLFLSRL